MLEEDVRLTEDEIQGARGVFAQFDVQKRGWFYYARLGEAFSLFLGHPLSEEDLFFIQADMGEADEWTTQITLPQFLELALIEKKHAHDRKDDADHILQIFRDHGGKEDGSGHTSLQSIDRVLREELNSSFDIKAAAARFLDDMSASDVDHVDIQTFTRVLTPLQPDL